MEYYEQAQPLPGYPQLIPGRSPAYYPTQNFDRPDQSDPLAPYALPIRRPPVVPVRLASHTRHPRHYGSYEERHYRDERGFRGYDHRLPVQLQHQEQGAPPRGHDYDFANDEIWTDASMESDVSEALSANSFTFDGTIPNIGERQTDNEGEAEVGGEGAVDDRGKNQWRRGRVVNAGDFRGVRID